MERSVARIAATISIGGILNRSWSVLLIGVGIGIISMLFSLTLFTIGSYKAKKEGDAIKKDIN